jgi:hypothetical protein
MYVWIGTVANIFHKWEQTNLRLWVSVYRQLRHKNKIKSLGQYVLDSINWKGYIEHITKFSATCYIMRSVKPCMSLKYS